MPFGDDIGSLTVVREKRGRVRDDTEKQETKTRKSQWLIGGLGNGARFFRGGRPAMRLRHFPEKVGGAGAAQERNRRIDK